MKNKEFINDLEVRNSWKKCNIEEKKTHFTIFEHEILDVVEKSRPKSSNNKEISKTKRLNTIKASKCIRLNIIQLLDK